jgi:type IV pilus assembly protein PilC
MLFSSQLPLKSLIEFCRVLRHNLGAGLSIVKVFRQQADRGSMQIRPIAGRIGEELEKGESLESALKNERQHFPGMFVSLAVVGEQSGSLPEVLTELEKYFLVQQKLGREFRRQIAWPVFQFVVAGLVIPAMILLLSLFNSKFDPLGFGLTGVSGAVTFMLFFYGTPVALIIAYKIFTRSLSAAAAAQRVLLRLWAIGPCLQAIALMRFCLALRLTMETAMPVKRALRLSLAATGNAAFEAQAGVVEEAIRDGENLSLALTRTGVFPEEFLGILTNAEEGGRLVEVMANQADYYQDEATRRMSILSQVTAWSVYILIACVIIFLIFRLYSSYIGVINSLT